jgi:hypothetical protein
MIDRGMIYPGTITLLREDYPRLMLARAPAGNIAAMGVEAGVSNC